MSCASTTTRQHPIGPSMVKSDKCPTSINYATFSLVHFFSSFFLLFSSSFLCLPSNPTINPTHTWCLPSLVACLVRRHTRSLVFASSTPDWAPMSIWAQERPHPMSNLTNCTAHCNVHGRQQNRNDCCTCPLRSRPRFRVCYFKEPWTRLVVSDRHPYDRFSIGQGAWT